MGRNEKQCEAIVVNRGPERGYLEALWSAVALSALRDWVVYHPESCGTTIGAKGARIGDDVQAWGDANLWLFDESCVEPSREACQMALPVTFDDLRAKAVELMGIVDSMCGGEADERARRAAWVRLMARFRDDDFWGHNGGIEAGASEDGRDTGVCACGEEVYAHGACRNCYSRALKIKRSRKRVSRKRYEVES